MFIFRLLKRKRLSKSTSLFHIFLSACFVSTCIFLWKTTGCPGFPNFYLCRSYSSKCFTDYSYSNSTFDDFSRLVNLDNFTFTVNKFDCNNSTPLLVVLIHTKPSNFKKRWTIRNTWGKISDDRVKIFFLIGLVNSSLTENQLIVEEKKYGDFIQGSFMDSYRNLTYKHAMGLKWMKYFCPQAKYLLKTDDDVYVYMSKLMKFLETDMENLTLFSNDSRFIWCLLLYNGLAFRSSRMKWRVTWSEYNFRYYPTYCQGFAILYSSDALVAVYEKVQMTRYFWIDDVFVTGLARVAANVSAFSFHEVVVETQKFKNDSDIYRYFLGPPNLSMIDIVKLWLLCNLTYFNYTALQEESTDSSLSL